MNAIPCAWVRERAPELALGVLHGGERAEMLLHVAGCARCQGLVTELTEVADALPLAVADAEPSPGFGARVVAAMGSDRRRARRRRILTLAATAAAAAIVSVTLVRVIDAGSELPRQSATPVLRSVPMRAAAGNPVGRVVVSGGNPAALLVNVDYAVADGEYRLELLHDGAKPARLGTIGVVNGRGSWRGTSPMAAGGNTLAMVDGGGTTVCNALLTVPTVS